MAEQAEYIKYTMDHHGNEQRAGGVHGKGKQKPGKKVHGKLPEIKVQKCKKHGADENAAGHVDSLVFPAENASEHQFFAKGGNDSIGENHADNGKKTAAVLRNKGVIKRKSFGKRVGSGKDHAG